MDKKQIEQKSQVRFPSEVFQAMKRLAKKHDRSFNGEIVHALRFYIAQQEGQSEKSIQVQTLPE